MAKIRLTKSELKKQKETLKRFVQYLPTLQLKKQQLQKEVSRVQNELEMVTRKADRHLNEVSGWVDVFSEGINIEEYTRKAEVLLEYENIAGIDIPILKNVGYKGEGYDLEKTPLWVDSGIAAVETMMSYNIQTDILQRQLELLQEELRMTSQRVNLFEKVKIPETKENIRKIRIFLGDMQTAEVVTGKIAKAKIQKKQETVAA